MATRGPFGSLRTTSRAGALAWSGTSAALATVLLLALGLYTFRLDQNGFGNPYYAAAVKSMLQSWHHFFFVSFDPGGFVSVDKPPLGLWVQVVSAKLFGFSGLSLLLPQAVASVVSIAVVCGLVRRSFGPLAGLLAALAQALTPITVAAARNNTSDVVLVLILLLAAGAVLRATETGRLRWLVLGAALVGAGFNVKMLEAFLPLPAYYLEYLVAARRSWRARLAHLSVATIVLLGVSLSWAAVVDLTPADQRPYVGSSADNTVRNLIFGYNGMTRLLGMFGPGGPGGPPPQPGGDPPGSAAPGAPAGSSPSPAGVPGMAAGVAPPFGSPPGAGFPPGPPPGGPGWGPGGGGENGAASPLRLINQQLGGQISWLMPLALFGLAAAVGRQRRRWPLDRQQQSLLLWGTWLLTTAAFFSVAGMFHRYYLVMLAPPIAALVGIGGTALWADYRQPGPRGWLLPVALLTTCAVQLRLLADYPEWSDRLTLPVGGLCVATALTLAAGRLWPRLRRPAVSAVAVSTAGLALLVAPAGWAAYPAVETEGMRNMLPFAGPLASGAAGPFGGPPPGGPPPPGGALPVGMPSWGPPPGATLTPFGGPPPAGGPPPPGMDSAASHPRFLRYVQANRGSARFLFAVPSSMQAAPAIIATGEPVMALGGFAGADPILTTDHLASLVADGTVRFFLLPAAGGFGPGGGGPVGPGQAELTRWVDDHCPTVPAEVWGGDGSASAPRFSAPTVGSGMQLYDCVNVAAPISKYARE